MQLCAHTGKIVKIREKSPQLSWWVLSALAVALVACGKPAPKEIPPHQIVPPADQGEFKSGEAFKLVVEPKVNVLREAAAGIEYGWKVAHSHPRDRLPGITSARQPFLPLVFDCRPAHATSDVGTLRQYV